MRLYLVFVPLLTALFWACTHDKGTGPDGGGDDGYALEGCWELILREELTDSGWVDQTSSVPDTMAFLSDTSWIGHFYSINPFDSSVTMGSDFGDMMFDLDSIYLQSQSNLAVFIGYEYRLSNDTLFIDESQSTVSGDRDNWIKTTCDL